jgi:fatty acid desaturase
MPQISRALVVAHPLWIPIRQSENRGKVSVLPFARCREKIVWRDLVRLSPLETAHELALSWPWLAISLYAAAHRHPAVALAFSFMFFLTGLRQVHGAFHYSIGLSRRWTESTMFVLSVAMLGSMHAVQINHLRHHRHCLEDEDIEAMSAGMPVWKAIVTGPLFPWRLHRKALQVATRRQRRRIAAELCATALMFAAAAAGPHWLQYHVLAMTVGHCLASFFAVWTVHHDCDKDGLFARTIRGAVRGRITYAMFYHVEHHLFPAVPTRHLSQLARRLDAVAPELASRRVF